MHYLKELKAVEGRTAFENDGFENLVIAEDHKKIVKALVKTHSRGSRSINDGEQPEKFVRQLDLVKGKGLYPITSKSQLQTRLLTPFWLLGRGLIILLHGVPGVGKTSTAGEDDRHPRVIGVD